MRRLAAFAGDDQRARVRRIGRRRRRRRRHEQQVDRLLEHDAVGDVDEGAVGASAVLSAVNARVAEVGELAEIALDDLGVLASRAAASEPDAHARRQAARSRQLGDEAPVDDDQHAIAASLYSTGELGLGRAARHRRRSAEFRRRDRRDVREPPLFVAYRREAERSEARRARGRRRSWSQRGPAARPLVGDGQPRLKLARLPASSRLTLRPAARSVSIQP